MWSGTISFGHGGHGCAVTRRRLIGEVLDGDGAAKSCDDDVLAMTDSPGTQTTTGGTARRTVPTAPSCRCEPAALCISVLLIAAGGSAVVDRWEVSLGEEIHHELVEVVWTLQRHDV